MQAIKPIKPRRTRLYHLWLMLVCLRDMTPAFTKAKVSYYVVKIVIQPTTFTKTVSFHLSKKRKRNHVSKWTCKKRVLSEGQPACVDVDADV